MLGADIASAVLTSASPDFGYLTVPSVLVDGGFNTGRPMVVPPGFTPPA
ncbi:hypothetical protein [Amycolatopsis sp. MJM2582]|nr:hypothetical protein [Amycolatopsis sp. MJM2582]